MYGNKVQFGKPRSALVPHAKNAEMSANVSTVIVLSPSNAKYKYINGVVQDYSNPRALAL